jgi:hypothetical protein
VDGGVKADNIGEIAAAGADAFVAGSAIFREPRTRQAMRPPSRRCAGPWPPCAEPHPRQMENPAPLSARGLED